uniref:PsbP C-terminal domain-containing protein n=1 Tax=Alexandrium andersonii TaxID=327968 RepID=A0A7S2BDY5_9DINO
MAQAPRPAHSSFPAPRLGMARSRGSSLLVIAAFAFGLIVFPPQLFLATTGLQRRAAVFGGLAPAVVGSAAQAEEPLRVTVAPGVTPLYSFELPASLGFEKSKPQFGDSEQVAFYIRKDGAVISAGPLPEEDFVKGQRSTVIPGSGKSVKAYKLTAEQDDLEVVESSEVAPGTSNLIAGRRAANHEWLRALKGRSGQFLMILELPQDKFKTEGAAMQAVLDSFRLGA